MFYNIVINKPGLDHVDPRFSFDSRNQQELFVNDSLDNKNVLIMFND